MQRFRPTLTLALSILVAGTLLWAGCDSSGSAGGPAEGQFTLNLTDDPADLDSAVVTIDRVDLVTEDGEDGDGDDDGDGTITLTDQTRTIDLLQLQDGVDSTLAEDVTVPEGEYAQLRLVLKDSTGANYVITNTGEQQNLEVPSGAQSGIKIVLPGEVEVENDGDEFAVTLDFDAEDSFVETGNGQHIFKPTVRVKSVFVNGESVQMVSVDGRVSSTSSDAVTVDDIEFAVTNRTEFDDDDGVSGPGDLQEDQVVEVNGRLQDDGTYEALDVEVEDDSEVERSITAPVEEVSIEDSTITQLGVTIQVTENTEFDDDGGLSAIETGTRLETDYYIDNGRFATEVEREDD
ncbi:MAG: DUF4382 domain-containing protein [Salinivenus sp.]